MNQKELNLKYDVETPEKLEGAIASMLVFLRQHEHWVSAADVCARFDWRDKRKPRLLCAKSDARIISSPQGYMAIEFASIEEIRAAAARKEAAAKALNADAIAIRNRGHAQLHSSHA